MQPSLKTMIYGVFSDIHGNLHALIAMLNRFKKLGIENYIFCGDLVGYGPKPNECIEIIMELKNLHCVLGNHDSAVLGSADLGQFTSYAVSTIEYARNVLSDKSKNFLLQCRELKKEKTFTVVHGSPKDPLHEYLTSGEQFLENLKFFDTSICFTGHTHIAAFFKQKGARFPQNKRLADGDTVAIERGCRYVLNPGAVGQPRDGNPFASCAVFDSEKNTYKISRIDYPYKKTQAEMQKLGFPNFLIERLEKGL